MTPLNTWLGLFIGSPRAGSDDAEGEGPRDTIQHSDTLRVVIDHQSSSLLPQSFPLSFWLIGSSLCGRFGVSQQFTQSISDGSLIFWLAHSSFLRGHGMLSKGAEVVWRVARGIATAFVLISESKDVAGFYTLSSLSIPTADLPEKLAKKLPSRNPIGVILLGRMAVHSELKGQGLGEFLLMHPLERAPRF
jgi:GNAT superfamily N-acetyltransferase